jgi:hypothetical protein
MNIFHVAFQILNIIVSVSLFFVSIFLSNFGIVLPSDIDPVLFGVVVSAIFYLSLSRISQILELSERASEIEITINDNINKKMDAFTNHLDNRMRDMSDNVVFLTEKEVIPRILTGISVHPISQQREKLDSNFSLGQKKIKDAIRGDLLNRQSIRLVHLEYNDWTHIYNFDIIHTILYPHTFSGKIDDYTKNVVRDYTVSWNADRVFGQYSFETYFQKVINQRESDRNCTTRIKFLIFVDFDGPISKELSRFNALDAAIQLERSILGIFDIYKSKYMSDVNGEEITPYKLYKEIIHGNHFFSLRVLTRLAYAKVIGINASLVEQPFNVYSDYCVSKSRVRNLTSDPPIPHLEIAINTAMVNEYTDTFDRMWEAAFSVEDQIFSEGDSWKVFGTGDFVKKWSDKSLGSELVRKH